MISEAQKLNIPINLDSKNFNRRGGLFSTVAEGRLTNLISFFTQNEAAELEFLQMLIDKDDAGRTPLDIACF